jgi:transposase
MIHPRPIAAGVVMRGTDEASGSLFSYVDLEARIPARHPLRKIRQVVNDALASLDAEFAALYTDFGRPSIPPERLIRAGLIQILFSVRSERQLMEQMQYNLLFRWFVGLGIDDPVWVPTVFTKNRDRLLTTEMSRKVMAAILAHREVAPLLSDEHFSVDGTLVKAWASMKSFQPKDRRHAARRRPRPPARTRRPTEDQPEPQRTRNAPDATPDPPYPQCRRRFPGREAVQCHPCFDHRPGGPALQEAARHRRDAVLHRPCADGEPEWAHRAGRPDPGRWPCRTARRAWT